MTLFILIFIALIEFLFYILCFKHKSHLITIVFAICTCIPVLGIAINSSLVITLCILSNVGESSGYELAELKDTKFNRWLFNHLNWK